MEGIRGNLRGPCGPSDIDIAKEISENIDIDSDINIAKGILWNIDIDIAKKILKFFDIANIILKNIDIAKEILGNIDKGILQNFDIDKILYW